MTIQEIERVYEKSPQAKALVDLLGKKTVKSVSLEGLVCSSAPIFFASMFSQLRQTILFVLDDADEAGYFYHDLMQMLGQENVLFFPSSYRRAIKYGQKDSANEILRTEVLARLSQNTPVFVVSYPDLPGCLTCGETIETAVTNAVDAKKAWLEAAIEEGIDIYEPDSLDDYSGQFKLRIPKSLHRMLAEHSQREGISMNQYCVYLLSRNDALYSKIKN